MKTHKALIASVIVTACLLNGCDSLDSTNAEDHYKLALEHIQKDNSNAGIIELKNAIQKNTAFSQARWTLGEMYLKMGDGNASSNEFKQALEQGYKPQSMIPYYEAILKTGDFNKALEETEKVSQETPSAEVLSIRAHAYMGLNNIQKANALLNEAIALNQESLKSLLGLARLSLAFNDLDKANESLNKALTINPDDNDALSLKGTLEFSRKNYPAAIDAYRHALKGAEFNPNILFGLLRALVSDKKYDEASAVLNKTFKFFPGNIVSSYYKGYLDYLQDDYESAKLSLRTVLKTNRRHPRTLLLLGNINYKEGQMEQAEEYLSEYHKYVPENHSALKLLAAVQIRLKQNEKAIENLLVVLEQNPGDAKAHTLLGNAYMNSGKFDAGMESLKQASDISPDSRKIKMQIALSHLVQGNYDDAIDDFSAVANVESDDLGLKIFRIMSSLTNENRKDALTKAEVLIQQHPDNPHPLNLAGVISMGDQDYELARLYFNKALQKNDSFVAAKLNLAAIDASSGNQASSQQLYQEILEQEPANLEAQLGLARLYLQQEKPETAFKVLKSASENNPKSIKPIILLSHYYLATNNPRLAIVFAEKGIGIAPDNSDIQLTYAKALTAAGKKDEANTQIMDLSEQFKNSAPALVNLAKLQMQLKNQDEARTILKQALAVSNKKIEVLSILARFEQDAGKYTDAEKYIQQIRDFIPQASPSYLLKGRLYRAMNKNEAALKELRQAEKYSPDDHNIIIAIYQTLIALQQRDKAIETLQQWQSKHPDNMLVKTYLASQHEYFGDIENARKLYEDILKVETDNILSLNNLAWIYFKQGNQKAVTLAKQAFALASNNAQVIDTYAWILVSTGQLEEGQKLLQDAHILEPDSAGIQYHLATALEALGQADKAIELLTQALSSKNDFDERADAQALLNKLK